MWDLLITLGNLMFLPSLIPTIINKHAYVPRLTSAIGFVATGVIVAGLIGEGLVASPIVLSIIGFMWLLTLVLRGEKLPDAEPGVVAEAPAQQSAD